MVLALVGKPAAGKGTVIRELKKRTKGLKVIRFSDALSEALNIFLDEIKREDQQWLAGELRQRFGRDVLAKAVEKRIKEGRFRVLVLDGVRVVGEERMVRRRGGKIIFIEADAQARWARSCRRGEKKDDQVSFKKFLELDSADSEKEIAKIGRRADFKIDNNGSQEQLKKQVAKIKAKLKL